MRNYPVIDVEKTGKKLLRECELREISTKELQQFLGLSGRQSIYTWFQGKALPTLDNFYALSRFLGIAMEELVICREEEDVQDPLEGQYERIDVRAMERRHLAYFGGLYERGQKQITAKRR